MPNTQRPDDKTRQPTASVLLVDDEPGIRSFLSKILTGAGYQVLEAKNGREAVRHVEASGAAADLSRPASRANRWSMSSLR